MTITHVVRDGIPETAFSLHPRRVRVGENRPLDLMFLWFRAAGQHRAKPLTTYNNTGCYLKGLRPMPPPSDFRDFSKISNFSKNVKNCIFINFWAPGMLNSYSAHQKVGNRWSQINFSSKFKNLSEIQKIESGISIPLFLRLSP